MFTKNGGFVKTSIVNEQKGYSLNLRDVKISKNFPSIYFTIIFAEKQRDGRNKTSRHVVAYVCDQCHCTNYIFDLDKGIFLDDSSMVAHCFC